MQPRRSLRLLAGALVLAVPLLSSCGFDKATDRVYTPAAGVNDRTGEVDVLSAVVVAAQPNSGTFIATLSNNSPTKEDSLESVAAATSSSDNTSEIADLTFGELPQPVDVPARGFVNMADNELGVPVTGDFGAGDFLHITLTFSSGATTTMKIPVVYACDEWADLDTSAGGASTGTPPATATPSASPSDSESASSSALPTPTPSETGSASSSASAPGEAYNCSTDLYDSSSASPSASE